MRKFVCFVSILAVFCFLLNANLCLAKDAKDFTLELIDGDSFILTEALKEKEVVLVFWTTWCPVCSEEIPHIEEFYADNDDSTLVIGINAGESERKVKSFVKKKNISYPVAVDTKGDIARLYNVTGVPTIIAINKNKKIIYDGHHIKEMKQEIKVSKGKAVEYISYDEFMMIKKSGMEYVLVDVLSEESYENGHIEGAISFPLNTIDEDTAGKMFSEDSNIIVYCGSFKCSASTKAAEKLLDLGYNVVDYKGGLKEWQEKGNKLVK